MRLLIVGADAAGMSAASQARRLDAAVEIVVLEAGHDVSYGACGLPYKLPDGEDLDELVAIPEERFRNERRIDLRVGHRVTQLDPAQHLVRGQTAEGAFELGYDRLLLATGARVVTPPIPGLLDLFGRGAYPLKTLADGRALKEALASAPRRAVVVGGGYIGLEATDALRQAGLEVTIVEAMPHLLPFLSEPMRERVYEEARAHGVGLLRGTLVQSVERQEKGIALRTSAGELHADLLLIATGVRPSSELAAEAGLRLGPSGAIAVDDELRTSCPDIYAAGDCADARHGVTGRRVWIPLALRANRAGKLAGGNLLGAARRSPPVMGTAVFKFFGLEIARTGLSEAEAAESGLQVAAAEVVARTRAKYYPGGGKLSVWLLGERGSRRLVGAALVGPESAAHRIDTLVAALHAGMTVDQLYDLDLGYAPPFGPSWSPILTGASKLRRAL